MKGFAAAAIVAALLGGCAAVTLAPRDSQPFDLLGRILVTYSGGALTANLRWQHDPTDDQIWLMTPTGQTLAYIVGSPQGATLTRADQREYRASSVEALTRQALGWPLPLSFLQYWVQGRPAPGAAPSAAERDADGRFLAFTQNGWHVAIGYYSEGEMSGRVRRLDLSDGANEIRLVIDTWRNAS
ncbi:MAG: outer rane lipoprotein LolB [Betaproteobacteria bacterium]|jgi:outer membrane lipoprotein LolB